MTVRTLLAWSGGKDSAMALYGIRQTGNYEVERLLTTVTQDYDRVCMHGVRTALLEQQARAVGLPLDIIRLPKDESQEGYDAKMRAHMMQCREQGMGNCPRSGFPRSRE